MVERVDQFERASQALVDSVEDVDLPRNPVDDELAGPGAARQRDCERASTREHTSTGAESLSTARRHRCV
jgi:hypothetical protein